MAAHIIAHCRAHCHAAVHAAGRAATEAQLSSALVEEQRAGALLVGGGRALQQVREALAGGGAEPARVIGEQG